MVAKNVKLSVQSEPKEVEVYLGDKKLGMSKDELQLERGDGEVELTFKAKGYEPKAVKVKPSGDVVLPVELKPVRRSGGTPGKKTPGALEF